MPISTYTVSLNDIQSEFGGTAPTSINEYYAGGANVPSGTYYNGNSGSGLVPSSGQISFSQFQGAPFLFDWLNSHGRHLQYINSNSQRSGNGPLDITSDKDKNVIVSSLQIDPNGNFYQENVVFGAVTKLNNLGNVSWSKFFANATNNATFRPWSVVCDNSGNTYVALDNGGHFIKLDSSGNTVWKKNYNLSNYNRFRMVIDQAGSYIYCVCREDNSFGGYIYFKIDASTGGLIWMRYYGPGGVIPWSHDLGLNDDETLLVLAVSVIDNNQNVAAIAVFMLDPSTGDFRSDYTTNQKFSRFYAYGAMYLGGYQSGQNSISNTLTHTKFLDVRSLGATTYISFAHQRQFGSYYYVCQIYLDPSTMDYLDFYAGTLIGPPGNAIPQSSGGYGAIATSRARSGSSSLYVACSDVYNYLSFQRAMVYIYSLNTIGLNPTNYGQHLKIDDSYNYPADYSTIVGNIHVGTAGKVLVASKYAATQYTQFPVVLRQPLGLNKTFQDINVQNIDGNDRYWDLVASGYGSYEFPSVQRTYSGAQTVYTTTTTVTESTIVVSDFAPYIRSQSSFF